MLNRVSYGMHEWRNAIESLALGQWTDCPFVYKNRVCTVASYLVSSCNMCNGVFYTAEFHKR